MNEQLDPQVVNLTKAVRDVESGNNPTARGKSGEYGAYQFTPSTWNAYASEAGVNVPLEQATSAQQNQVAYTKMKKWKDMGYNVGQTASMWNAGAGRPNAYLEGNAGVNSSGVAFDTKAYANQVADKYQEYKQSSGGPAAGAGALGGAPGYAPPSAPTSSQAPQGQGQEQSGGIGGGIMDVAKGIGNFLFPIAGDVYNDVTGKNDKTALQQLGDLGLSALPFVPVAGEAGIAARAGVTGAKAVGEIAAEQAAKGAAEKVAPTLAQKFMGSTVAKSAALGYGAGTAQNLSEGKGLGESIAPNVTNVLGAATGGVLGKALPMATDFIKAHTTPEGAVASIEKNLTEELKRTVPGRELAGSFGDGTGKRATSLLARSGIGNLIKVEGNHYNVTDAIDAAESRINELGKARAAALDHTGATVSLNDLESQALARASAAQEGATAMDENAARRRLFSGKATAMEDGIKKTFEDIRTALGHDNLTPSDLELLKEEQASASKIYNRTGVIGDRNAAAVIADTARTRIEKIADEAGFGGMKEYNQYIKDHYDAIKVLNRIGRHVVRGGRLGNMLREHTLGIAASGGAALAGGGLPGALAALFAGETAMKGFNKIFSETSISNPLRDSIIEKMKKEDPAAVQQLMQYIGRTEPVAPLGVASKAKPSKGLIQNGLIQAGIRGATTIGSAATRQ